MGKSTKQQATKIVLVNSNPKRTKKSKGKGKKRRSQNDPRLVAVNTNIHQAGGGMQRVKNGGNLAKINIDEKVKDYTMLAAIPIHSGMLPQFASQANTFVSMLLNVVTIKITGQLPNTTAGGLCFGFHPDPEVKIPANEQGLQMLVATAGSMQVNIWGKHSFSIRPSILAEPNRARYIDGKKPDRWNCFGTFYIMMNGPATQKGSVNVNMEYDMTLRCKAIQGNNIPKPTFRGMFLATFNGTTEVRSVGPDYTESAKGRTMDIMNNSWVTYVPPGIYTFASGKCIPVQVGAVGSTEWKVLWGFRVNTADYTKPVITMQSPTEPFTEVFTDDYPIEISDSDPWEIVNFEQVDSKMDTQGFEMTPETSSPGTSQHSLEQRLQQLEALLTQTREMSLTQSEKSSQSSPRWSDNLTTSTEPSPASSPLRYF